jgi:hypothetical protein
MEQATKQGSSANKVVSLAEARERLLHKRAREASAPSYMADPTELDHLDLSRMTPEARDLFWFSVSRYAYDLAATACTYSDADASEPNGTITPYHVESAETHRLIAPPRRSRFGLGFSLDALQMVGAATCGALAARPGAADGASFVALAFAMMLTVGAFLVRQGMPDSYTSTL